MSNNNFTETFSDGTALTQAQLETALKSLTLDVGNTTQMTTGSTSGTFLKSNGDGVAASWGTPSDPLGPFAIRNYGLSTSISSGALTVALKTNAGNTPSSGDAIDVPFSNNGATTATYSALQVTGALSFTITASATLGFTGTSTNRVFVYAINNSGTIKLAVSGSPHLDNGAQATTTAMSSSADNPATLYATAVLTVTSRFLGWIDAALNSSGQWQTPSHINVVNNYPANIIFAGSSRATGTTANIGGLAVSSSSGSWSGTNNINAYETPTNLSVTLVTTGRPVALSIQPDTSGGGAWGKSALSSAQIRWNRDSAAATIQWSVVPASTGTVHALGQFDAIDTSVASGSHTYSFQLTPGGSGQMSVSNAIIIAREI